MAHRHFMEKLEKYADNSGYKYVVRADLDEGKRPVISITSSTGDLVEIDVEDWGVVADCIQRAIEIVGDHADDPLDVNSGFERGTR